jgi:asparagine synthase (glutamine-hydrolysing)
MINQFINDKQYSWITERIDSVYIAYIGRQESVHSLLSYLKQINEPDLSEVKEIAKSMVGNFAIVVETDDWLIGLVDRISGYRLFYRNNSLGCIISNSPRKLRNSKDKYLHPESDSIKEIKMVGYLTGNRTMDKNIFQMCAGEVLLCDKNNGSYAISSYFEFYSSNIRNQSNKVLIEELDNITDTIIKRNIRNASGRTIWVPLSGGLDSRLIVCKLKQSGYDNIRTYSYGAVGNFDAMRAKEVASALNIRWDFVPTTPSESRKYFLSQERKDYWKFSDGLSVIPNLHGMFALKSLINSKSMKAGDVVINGQSGDFITGQHIPIVNEKEIDSNLLLSCIMKKNYSLRRNMLADDDSIELMKSRITNSLGKYQHVTNYQDFAKNFEYWGWKERQTKRVVNGQNNYNYYGLNWELPLWDLEYMQFWVDLPLHQKVGRSLFVEYLNNTNFYGLFKNRDKFMSRWPTNRLYIQFLGNALRRTLGKDISDLYYKKLDWYSQYQYLYALTGKHEYDLHWKDYKSVYPYMTNVWLEENIKTK